MEGGEKRQPKIDTPFGSLGLAGVRECMYVVVTEKSLGLAGNQDLLSFSFSQAAKE